MGKLYFATEGCEVFLQQEMWAETFHEFDSKFKGEGLELWAIGDDISDAPAYVFEDGELKAVGYISTRGGWYQAGAFDGENGYFSTNIDHAPDELDGQWGEVGDKKYICTSIAIDAWEAFQQHKRGE